jgi:hypothetical protein
VNPTETRSAEKARKNSSAPERPWFSSLLVVFQPVLQKRKISNKEDK